MIQDGEFFVLDAGLASKDKAEEVPGKTLQVESNRKGGDPRTSVDGSAGWNDFGAKTPESEKSFADQILDFFTPDYSSGDNLGPGGASTKDAINDAAPSRNLSDNRGGGSDTLSPPLPIGEAIDFLTKSDDGPSGRHELDKNADNLNKNSREEQDRQKAEAERKQKEQDQAEKDQAEKDRQAKNDERNEKSGDEKNKDEKNKDSSDSDKQKDDDAKSKENGQNTTTPNPDQDRPQLSQQDIQNSKNQAAKRIGGGLTNPLDPASGDQRLVSNPALGKFRPLDFVTNPVPDNDANSTDRGSSGADRPKPKVDVRRGGLGI